MIIDKMLSELREHIEKLPALMRPFINIAIDRVTPDKKQEWSNLIDNLITAVNKRDTDWIDNFYEKHSIGEDSFIYEIIERLIEEPEPDEHND